MSYLKFDKTVMINLEESLRREILRTNRNGAYHCTTVVDCNTRKYHGLLVMPLPELDDDNHVLLSSLDETVIQHDAPFNLGLHKYAGNNYNPKGHKYIREFTCDTVPRTVYRVGGVVLAKEKVFSLYENRIMIKYTLEDAHSDTTLRFKPFLAFRNANSLAQENGSVNKLYQEIGKQLNGLMLKDGGPVIGVQIENEYQHSAAPWGFTYQDAPRENTVARRDKDITQIGVGINQQGNEFANVGSDHMKTLKQLAINAGLIAPIYTATGWGYASIIEKGSIPVMAGYAFPFWEESIKPSPFYLFKDTTDNH